MFKLLGMLIKLVIVVVILAVVSQLEYNGRKIQTYVVEFVKSYTDKDSVSYVKSKVKRATDYVDETDRKELQKLFGD